MDHYGAHHGLDFDGTEGLIETAKLFSSQRRFDQSAEYLQAALRAAQIAGDTRTVMKVWDLLADAHCRGRRCDEALRSIRSFLSVADSLGCNIDRAQARFRLVQAWIAEPDSIPGFDPFVVIAEIDRLMEPLLEEPDPGHALRRGRLVAEVLGRHIVKEVATGHQHVAGDRHLRARPRLQQGAVVAHAQQRALRGPCEVARAQVELTHGPQA